MQVYNSNVPGTGQFYPPDCRAGETADSGSSLDSDGVVYGPDFDNHPCGTASNTYTPWTPSRCPRDRHRNLGRSRSRSSSSSTRARRWTLTETLTYVNGAPGRPSRCRSQSCRRRPAPGRPGRAASPSTRFIGGGPLSGRQRRGLRVRSAPIGGRRPCDEPCAAAPVLDRCSAATTPPTNWSATGYGTIWDEISSGTLSDNVDSTICEDNGAALQWARLLRPLRSSIDTGVSFTGQAVPRGRRGAGAVGRRAIAALVLLLAVVGYVLARKTSLGA